MEGRSRGSQKFIGIKPHGTYSETPGTFNVYIGHGAPPKGSVVAIIIRRLCCRFVIHSLTRVREKKSMLSYSIVLRTYFDSNLPDNVR